MLNLFIFSLIFYIIILIILMINKFMSMMKYIDREKFTPFECGFDPLTNFRLPFSIKFFLITLIFLIFDLEIIILMPLIYLMKFYLTKMTFITIMIFMLFLIMSLMMEWMLNYLKWIN